MRVVADTNTVLSGLFWHGPPRMVLDAARLGAIRLYTSPLLLEEIEDVLSRKKFSARLVRAGLNSKDILAGYAALATVATSPRHRQVVLDDPDDDEVIACAVNARASVIVSGDAHLLRIGFFEGISILSAAEFVKIYISLSSRSGA